MFKKVVSTLGVVVGVSSLIIACAPEEGASVQTWGGLESQCSPLEDKGCDPNAGGGLDPKEEGKDGEPATYNISWCDPISVDYIKNPNDEKFFGNTRVVDVIDGKAACVNYENTDKGGVELCPFTPQLADDNKLPYVVGKGRNTSLFAIAGAPALGPDGKPGPYIYSQKVLKRTIVDRKTKTTTTRYSVPCLPTQGADTAAAPAGTELGGGCVVETINASTNAALHEHNNYCKLDVCARTGSNTDADAAGAAKSASVMCWKGEGAALNDPNGTERDPSGVYYAGVEACHRAWQVMGTELYEVTAAKRPTTSGYNPPKVVETTAIRWLPLAAGATIGNP